MLPRRKNIATGRARAGTRAEARFLQYPLPGISRGSDQCSIPNAQFSAEVDVGTWSGTVWIRIMAKQGTSPEWLGFDQNRSDSCGYLCSDKN